MEFLSIGNFTSVSNEFEYSETDRILFFFPMLAIIISGITIHIKLLKFLKKPTYGSQVITFQLKVNVIVLPLVAILGAIQQWLQNTAFQNTLICYIYSYFTDFIIITIENHSAFLTLFRFLCIVETNLILKFFGPNAPKVSQVCIFEYYSNF